MLKKIISTVAVLSVAVGANVQASTITVEKGDTLWDLSRAHNTSVENIQMLNHLSTDLIHPGDLLTIAKEKHYNVKLGDTLWDIARAHQVTVSQVKEWNHLHTDLIHPDSNLLIFEGMKASHTSVTEKRAMPVAQQSKNVTRETTAHATSNTGSNETTPVVAEPSTNNVSSKESTTEASNSVVKESSSAAAPSGNADPTETTPVTTPSTESKESTTEETTSTTTNSSKEIIVEATAYTASCEGCSGITSTGINLKENPDAKVISVDPTVIPLGSKVYVESYGEAIAGDTGGAIKGKRIDVFVPTKEDAINFGVKQLKVTILD